MHSYSGYEPYAFISYSHRNASKVHKILDRLEFFGVRYWFDQDLKPSDEYVEVIAERVEKSKFFIAFISTDSLNSRYCRDEIRFAYENGTPMMVLYLEPCELSSGFKMMLNGVQSFSLYEIPDREVCDSIMAGIPREIINQSGEKIYETDDYVFCFAARSCGNGYCIVRQNKSDGTTSELVNEAFPPASDYSLNYISRPGRFADFFEICVDVTWDFTYARVREDEYFEERYLYSFVGINAEKVSVRRETLWKRDCNSGERITYNRVHGVHTSELGGRLHIYGTDDLGNSWNLKKE